MSECVVRMEMPTENTVCELNYYSNSYYSIGYRGEWRCTITDKRCDHNKNGEFPSWCPIICSLPEGHGRLVDADAAVKDIRDEIFEYKMDGLKGTPMPTEHLWLMKNWIADEDICPTIVPAERSE